MEWRSIINKLNKQFDADFNLEGIIFLIGVQELGKGYQKLGKDQKLDVMHIAVCTLLSPYSYYEYLGKDEEGWPHWKRLKKLPPLRHGEQELLMKQAIIEYFKEL